MVELAWLLIILAVCGLAIYGAARLEPHWSSRDGRRFMCNAQELTGGVPTTRNHETQITVLADGALQVVQKRALRRRHSVWHLVGKSSSPPKGVEVYLAQQVEDGHPMATYLAVRIPRKSRCVAVLDEVLAEQRLSSTPSPGSAAPQDPPAPG